MDLIEWSDELSVGIHRLDSQHRVLIRLINSAYHASQNGEKPEELQELIEAMFDYVRVHFAEEEDLFDEHGYPESHEHQGEHQRFKLTAQEFYLQFRAGEQGVAAQIFDYLKTWLVEHIQVSDKKYSAFLISKGVR